MKVMSNTTSGHKMQVRSWLAELMMVRQNPRRSLPPYFWRDQRYKWAYMREVKAISKFIKNYGEYLVVKVLSENRHISTCSTYGNVEFLLQAEKNILDKLSLPKDITQVTRREEVEVEDLRTPRALSFNRKKSIFERLNELED